MNNIKLLERKIDKAEIQAYKVKRKARRALLSWKTKAMAVFIGILLASITLFVAFYNMSQWYDKNKVTFQTPVQIRPPVLVEAREVQVATKGATLAQNVIVESNLPIINDLYRKIRFVESGAGMNKSDMLDLHNYCQSIGQTNEIGYILEKGKKYCFIDYGEQWLTFKNWFTKRLATMTVQEAECVYNLGVKQPMCKYSMELDSIK